MKVCEDLRNTCVDSANIMCCQRGLEKGTACARCDLQQESRVVAEEAHGFNSFQVEMRSQNDEILVTGQP